MACHWKPLWWMAMLDWNRRVIYIRIIFSPSLSLSLSVWVPLPFSAGVQNAGGILRLGQEQKSDGGRAKGVGDNIKLYTLKWNQIWGLLTGKRTVQPKRSSALGFDSCSVCRLARTFTTTPIHLCDWSVMSWLIHIFYIFPSCLLVLESSFHSIIRVTLISASVFCQSTKEAFSSNYNLTHNHHRYAHKTEENRREV